MKKLLKSIIMLTCCLFIFTFTQKVNATWDITDMTNIRYFNIYYKIKYQNSVKTGYLGLFNPEQTPAVDSEYGMIINNGKATANIKNKLARKYKELGYNGEIIFMDKTIINLDDIIDIKIGFMI